MVESLAKQLAAPGPPVLHETLPPEKVQPAFSQALSKPGQGAKLPYMHLFAVFASQPAHVLGWPHVALALAMPAFWQYSVVHLSQESTKGDLEHTLPFSPGVHTQYTPADVARVTFVAIKSAIASILASSAAATALSAGIWGETTGGFLSCLPSVLFTAAALTTSGKSAFMAAGPDPTRETIARNSMMARPKSNPKKGDRWDATRVNYIGHPVLRLGVYLSSGW